MKEALFYKKMEEKKVRCFLCPHLCTIKEGKRGICNVRKNVNGELISENYGQVTALGFDPIEKKPLYHYHPGEEILSVGSFGCNLKCDFCQNWEISQSDIDNIGRIQSHSVEDIIEIAEKKPGNLGIAYTYNEPIIYYEFMFDIAKLAKEKGLKNVMVTNAFITQDPLEKLIEVIDAFSVDLKAFTDNFYKKKTAAHLKPVLDSLKTIKKHQKFLEITNLIIPGLNDDKKQFSEMIEWIRNELGEDTILHLSRYFPVYRSSVEPTPLQTLKKMYEVAKESLNYVYIGNARIGEGQDTYCPDCGKLLVTRSGYHTDLVGIDKEGKCTNCGKKVFVK